MSGGARRLAGGLGWPEGPALLGDGGVAFVEAYLGRVSMWRPDGETLTIADVGGGPNAAAIGPDGRLWLTQSGGVVGPWRSADPRPASIVAVDDGGDVEVVVSSVEGTALRAPNDLAFAREGSLYFTDSGHFDAVRKPHRGYVFRLAPSGEVSTIAELEPTYPNGIVLDVVEGRERVVWTESYTRRICAIDTRGDVEVLHEFRQPDAIPDGLVSDGEGGFYVATCASGGITHVSAAGEERHIPVGAFPTNCTWAGGRLIVTDGGHDGSTTEPRLVGALWSLEIAA